MSDELTPNERSSLDVWEPMEPPEGFADRVVAVRGARRWLPFAATAIACGAAAAIIAALLSKPGEALPDAALVALGPDAHEIDAEVAPLPDAAAFDTDGLPMLEDAAPTLHDSGGYWVDGSYVSVPALLSDSDNYDVEVEAGGTFTVHTPTDAASIKFRRSSCSTGRISGIQTGGVVSVQIDTDPTFNSATNPKRVNTGMTSAVIEAPVGTWHYRVTCTISTNGPATIGTFTVLRDDGTRKLPAQPTTITVEPDGKVWRVDYASKVPDVIVKRPPGGERFHLLDTKGVDRSTFIKDPTATTVRIDGATLTDQSYTYWFERGGVRVGLGSTLHVELDQGVQQISIEAPALDAVAKEPIDVRGTALDGWTITVDSNVVPVDAQHHFSTTAALNGIRAVAIKAKHTAYGIHYFLRRLRTP